MRLALVVLGAALLSACTKGYVEEHLAIQESVREVYLETLSQHGSVPHLDSLIRNDPRYLRAQVRRDSLISLGPSIRYYSDSLAQVDSVAYANLLMGQISDLYFENDTTSAVMAYLQAVPWLRALSHEARQDKAWRYARMIGLAVKENKSPYMAQLAFNALSDLVALSIRTGDDELFNHTREVVDEVGVIMLGMPDSVRQAFSPPQAQPVSFVAEWGDVGLGALGACIVVVLGFLFVRGGRQLPILAGDPFITEETEYLRTMADPNLALIDAIWYLTMRPSLTQEVRLFVIQKTDRKEFNQQAQFLAAGLLVFGGTWSLSDEQARKLIAKVRGRILRTLKPTDLLGQSFVGSMLPTDADQWARIWIERGFVDAPSKTGGL